MSDVEKRDSDSTPSEQRVEAAKHGYGAGNVAGLADPDAGLSDEERAKLVCKPAQHRLASFGKGLGALEC